MPRRGTIAITLWLALACVARAQEETPPAEAAPTEDAAQAPPVGAWLRYSYDQRLVEGTGQYDGYRESTTARARYEIVSVEGDAVTIRGQYRWSYDSPERTDSGAEDRTVAFSLASRRYSQERTDVSDYDSQNGTELATWIWIPPSAAERSAVPILEHSFVVEHVGVPITIAGAERSAIHVAAHTSGRRDDAYGNFATTIADEYWFDAQTGMFLREVHDEFCDGTLDGQPATFRLVTTIEVIDASYAPAATPPPPDDYTLPSTSSTPGSSSGYPSGGYRVYPSDDYSGRNRSFLERAMAKSTCPLFVFCLALAIGIGAFVYFRRRRVHPGITARGERFTVARVNEDLPPLSPGLSAAFDPFLPHFARVARASGQNVALARLDTGPVIGLAIGDRATDVASIFATDSDVCESLRSELGHSEFFSEVRHPKLASVARLNMTAPNEAYNVYETFEVMALEQRPEDLGYDTDLVSPMTDQDKLAALQLLNAVYGVRSDEWLTASLAAGDLGWVARVDGAVVGLAMATLVGAQARLHTLTVHKDHQNRGIGTALYRARLRGLFDLGATRIITECATWNVGALELARAHGFTTIGTMYVESARDSRVERKFVRR